MLGWLWVVIVVVLGVAIYLLLRNRAAGGRHRAPVAENAPPLEDGATPVDAETGFGPAATTGLGEPAAAELATEDERRSAPQESAEETHEELREELREETPEDRDESKGETKGEVREEVRQETREEEPAEHAELRDDEGYVETLDDPAPATAADPEPEPEPGPEA